MRTFLALLLLVGCGCVPEEIKHSNSALGYVRNVWQVYGGCYDVTFERDDGMVFVYSFRNQPAVWNGMRASFDYDYYDSDLESRCHYAAGLVQRLR